MFIEQPELKSVLRQNYKGTVEVVTKLPQTKNDGFHVSYGDGSERFVRAGKPFSQEKASMQIAVAGMLYNQGVATPRVISTMDERNCVSLDDGRVVEMHEWVSQGRPYQPTERDIGAVARAMAGLHSGADRLDKNDDAVRYLAAQPYTGMPPGAALPDAALIDHFTSRLPDVPESLQSLVARDLPLMKEALVTKIPGKDWGIIHADLHGEQTIFDKNTDELKALIDWEWMLYGPRARDLAYSLYRLSEWDGGISVTLARTFIDSYVQARPEFPAEDLAATSEHVEWDATCRRVRWITDVFRQVDSKKVNDARIVQLAAWFDDYSLEKARELRNLLL